MKAVLYSRKTAKAVVHQNMHEEEEAEREESGDEDEVTAFVAL